MRHILQKYTPRGGVYLTIRPPKAESSVNACKRAARRELNGRYESLVSFYKKYGFRLVERQADIELFIYTPTRCT